MDIFDVRGDVHREARMWDAANKECDGIMLRKLRCTGLFGASGDVRMAKRDVSDDIDASRTLEHFSGVGGETLSKDVTVFRSDREHVVFLLIGATPERQFVGVVDRRSAPVSTVYLFPTSDNMPTRVQATEVVRHIETSRALDDDAVNAMVFRSMPPRETRAERSSQRLSPSALDDVQRRDRENGIATEADVSRAFAMYAALYMAVQTAIVLHRAPMRGDTDVKRFFRLVHDQLANRSTEPHSRLYTSLLILRAFAHNLRTRQGGAALPTTRVDVGTATDAILRYDTTFLADPRHWKVMYSDRPRGLPLVAPRMRDLLLAGGRPSDLRNAWEVAGTPLVTTRHQIAGATDAEFFVPRKRLQSLTELAEHDVDALVEDAILASLNATTDAENDHCTVLPRWVHGSDEVVNHPYPHAQMVLDRARGTQWTSSSPEGGGEAVPLAHPELQALIDAKRGSATSVSISPQEWENMQIPYLSMRHRVAASDGTSWRPSHPVFAVLECKRVIQSRSFQDLRLRIASTFGDDTAHGWVRLESSGTFPACDGRAHVVVHPDAMSALRDVGDVATVANVTVLGRRGVTHDVDYDVHSAMMKGHVLRVYHPLFLVVNILCQVSRSITTSNVSNDATPRKEASESDASGKSPKTSLVSNIQRRIARMSPTRQPRWDEAA